MCPVATPLADRHQRGQRNIKLISKHRAFVLVKEKNLQSWEIRLVLLIVFLMLASINIKTHRVLRRVADLESNCPNAIRMGIE